MNNDKAYSINVPHFYCLEYCEDDKKMIVEIDFREDYFFLSPQLITHWEKPYDNIKIEVEEKNIIKHQRFFIEQNNTKPYYYK